MTLFKGAILVLESQPDGLQRKFKVLELSMPVHEMDGDGINTPFSPKPGSPETQLVRLEVVE